MGRFGSERGARICCGLIALGVALGVTSVSAQAPTAAGTWKNGDTTIRVTVNKTEVKAQFVEVGQNARTLGFKPGEVSFTATLNGNMMNGEQIIRYSIANCHTSGRKVPMMGRMTPNGQVLAVHYYMVETDPNCRDTGQYGVTETLWQRVAAR